MTLLLHFPIFEFYWVSASQVVIDTMAEGSGDASGSSIEGERVDPRPLKLVLFSPGLGYTL